MPLKSPFFAVVSLVFGLVVLVITPSRATADLIIDVVETGPNVRLEYNSGTLDVTGLGTFSLGSPVVHEIASDDSINNLFGTTMRFLAFPGSPFSSTPSANFSTTGTGAATTFGGSALLLDGGPTLQSSPLRLDPNDIAGTIWTGSGFMQWDGATLASLGLVQGSYQWTLSNAPANTITLNIGATAVPEPTGVALLGMGAIGLICTRRRKQAA